MKKYLPIGTILRLKGGSKRVMIFGRKQKIYFIGYQDGEELEYHDQYLSGEKA